MSTEKDIPQTADDLAERRRHAIDRLTEQFRKRLEEELVLEPQTLDEIEKQAQRLGRKTSRDIQDESTKACGDGYQGNRMLCHCRQWARFVGYRIRQVVTLAGEQGVSRACYHCSGCRQLLCPLDASLGLSTQRSSPQVIALSARFCCYLPFEMAARELELICGIRLAPSTLERYAQQVGTHIQQSWERDQERLQQRKLPASRYRPKQLHLSMDGAIIFVGGEWREAKLGCAYERQGERVLRAHYYGTLAKSSHFGQRMRLLAHRAGSDHCGHLGVVADGGPWIWQEVGKHFPHSVQILDYFHVSKHLWEVAHAQFGVGTTRANEWMEQQQEALLEDRSAQVRARVAAWAPRKLTDKDLQRKLLDYLHTHQQRLHYKSFRDQGWHIGSGVMEAGCKSVVKARLGGTGMRWSHAGAEAMLHLCSVWRSHEAPDFRSYLN